jgi:hypothetical protein
MTKGTKKMEEDAKEGRGCTAWAFACMMKTKMKRVNKKGQQGRKTMAHFEIIEVVLSRSGSGTIGYWYHRQ